MINLLDEKQISFRFNKAAKTYDQAAVLQQLVGEALLKRLHGIHCRPKTILDLGCGTGHVESHLRKAYPSAKIVGLDKSEGMLRQAQHKEKEGQFLLAHWICGCAEDLPFKDNSFELVYSNLVLHWSIDFTKSLEEIYRVLKPGGLLLFSVVGPDTLKELRYCWAVVDDKPHVHVFVDMHDVGDSLLRALFTDPVMDVDYFTLLYSNPMVLMRELQELGVQNINADRQRGLTTKSALKKLIQAYEVFRNANGRLPATWEIIYGHAWVSEAMAKKQNSFGEVKIPIHNIQTQIRKQAG